MNRLFGIVALIGVVAGCGPGAPTTAEVKFRNDADAGTGPDVFEMKLVKIALMSSDEQTVIYGNPDCDSLTGCEAEESFDFVAERADVDASRRTILTGTYRRHEATLCSGAAGPVVRWQAGTMAAPREYLAGCTRSRALDEKLEVLDGHALTVTFHYDAASRLEYGKTAQGEDCTEPPEPRVCFSVPELDPEIDVTVTVE